MKAGDADHPDADFIQGAAASRTLSILIRIHGPQERRELLLDPVEEVDGLPVVAFDAQSGEDVGGRDEGYGSEQ